MTCAWRHLTIGAVALAAWTSSGCKTLEEYRQLEFENGQLKGENDELSANVERERAAAKECAAVLEQLDERFKQRQAMIALIERQRDDYKNRYQDADAELKECLRREPKEPIVITQPALPPVIHEALKELARKYPDRVTYDPQSGMVKFGSDLLFNLGQDTVQASATEALAAFAEIMSSPTARAFDVIVVGHTDSVPIRKQATIAKHPTNWHLSVHRAISVMRALRAAGVTEDRMGVLGYGELRPIAANGAAGNQANRRVELYIVARNSVCVAGATRTTTAAPRRRTEQK